MAVSSYGTTLSDLFDPEVVGDEIDKKLIDLIKFTPLAIVDTTLQGTAGSKIKLPSYAYIGDASSVGESDDLPIAKLTQTTEEVEIEEYGIAVEITDRAKLMGYGNPVDQATYQIALAISSAVENRLITEASENCTLTYTASNDSSADDVADALTEFGEDMDGEKVLLIPPALYAELRKSTNWIPNTELGANIIVNGTVGMIHGCQVVPTNRLTDYNEAYIVKPGALAIFSKRDTFVEFDRDILGRVDVIAGSKLFAPYVYDKTKIVKISLAAAE